MEPRETNGQTSRSSLNLTARSFHRMPGNAPNTGCLSKETRNKGIGDNLSNSISVNFRKLSPPLLACRASWSRGSAVTLTWAAWETMGLLAERAVWRFKKICLTSPPGKLAAASSARTGGRPTSNACSMHPPSLHRTRCASNQRLDMEVRI